ncbi:hypothetical protein M2G69_04325 [Vibrio vulnificus]|nr:hypothetical protein [Vibrio vulnificus]
MFNNLNLSVDNIKTVITERKPIASRVITNWGDIDFAKKKYVTRDIDGVQADWVCLTYKAWGYRYLLVLTSIKKKEFDIYFLGDEKVGITHQSEIVGKFNESMDTYLLLQAYGQLKGERGSKPSIWKRKEYFTEIYFGLIDPVKDGSRWLKPKYPSFKVWERCLTKGLDVNDPFARGRA